MRENRCSGLLTLGPVRNSSSPRSADRPGAPRSVPIDVYRRGDQFHIHLETEKLEANFDRGVPSITIPVAEHAKPRRVQVTTSGTSSRIIEGHGATRT
jgi:HSP20 family protein